MEDRGIPTGELSPAQIVAWCWEPFEMDGDGSCYYIGCDAERELTAAYDDFLQRFPKLELLNPPRNPESIRFCGFRHGLPGEYPLDEE